MQESTELPRIAWHLSPWLATVGAVRSSFYTWGPDIRPKTVLVGRHRLVIESPEAWLARMVERQTMPRKTKRQRRQPEQSAAA